VYETFGIPKLFPVKLQLLLIRAKTPDKPLTAKCFIQVVCAQHEQRSHLVKLNEKIQKCKFEFRKARLSVNIFPEGESPLRAE
jgi:hypothetical protein